MSQDGYDKGSYYKNDQYCLMEDSRLTISVEAGGLLGSTNFDLHTDANGINLPR